MRLHKHEELVEAICDALMDLNTGSNHKRAAAALAALLEAAVRLEVAEIADVDGLAKPYSIIALRMEASDDK